MIFTKINFAHPDTTRVYDAYLKRIECVVSSLPKTDQLDITMEINSHIYESFHAKKSTPQNELTTLLDILEKLGTPEENLKPLIADKFLLKATKTFNPQDVFKALALNFTNGFSYVVFGILYLLLFAFLFLIVSKIINPEQTGLHIGQDYFSLGLSNGNNTKEILGNAFIPLMILCAVIFYLFITLLLKLKRKINKK